MTRLHTQAACLASVMAEQAPKSPPPAATLGELIDAAVLAHERFRTCRCREDCPHDGAMFDADEAVKAHLIGKIGLTPDQIRDLGGMI